MSELREDLLVPRITKKKVISVIIVSVLLIAFFASSVYLTSLIFGTQRIDPSEKVEDAEYDKYLLVLPPLPDDFKDLLDDLDPDLLKDLGLTPEDVAEFLEEMNDGDIDNYDLTMAGLVIAALLGSEIEVFRVFDYDDPDEDFDDILWKYQSFDQFNGDGWESTVPKSITPEYDFPTLLDYQNIYAPMGLDKIDIKLNLSTNPGVNSMVMGSLFPEPYIIEENISAHNLNPPAKLYKDDMGSVIGDLTFSSAETVDMTYQLFGLNLPTNDDINNTAERAIYTPNAIGIF